MRTAFQLITNTAQQGVLFNESNFAIGHIKTSKFENRNQAIKKE